MNRVRIAQGNRESYQKIKNRFIKEIIRTAVSRK
jgi:hypothetical protein